MFLDDFADACTRHASRPAAVIGGRAHTYGELGRRVAGMRSALEALPREERFIGVVAHDHLDTYAAVFAIMLEGRCFVPINPAHPSSRNRSIVDQVGLRTVFLGSLADVDAVLGAAVARPLVAAGVPSSEVPPEPSRASRSDLAYVLFTSGSSGLPKGVPITVGNVDAFLSAFYASAAPIDEHDRVLQMFDLTFDFSVVAFMAPLCRGAVIYTIPPHVIKFTYIAELLEDAQLTQLPLVPSVLTNLRPYFGDLHVPSVRHTFFCGEALHADLLMEWSRSAPSSRLTNYYGPTEATVFAMYYRWDPSAEPSPRAHNGIVSIGAAMEKMSARVFDEHLRPVARGEKGELCLAGPQVTPGYFRDPERNARSFFEFEGVRYYRTGDLALEESDGNFTFLGRLDHQIKLNGYRVELAEIEHHARILVEPSAAVVVDAPGDDGLARLHLFVDGFHGDEAALIASLKSRLPHYMVPATVTSLSPLPLNANGKVDRLRLREIARGSGRDG